MPQLTRFPLLMRVAAEVEQPETGAATENALESAVTLVEVA